MDYYFPGEVPLINERTVLYFEEEDHPLLNKVLQQYQITFSNLAQEKDYTFIYLPCLQYLELESLERISNQLRYLYPHYFRLEEKGIFALLQYLFNKFPGEKIYERFKDLLGRLRYPKGGFLIFDDDVALTKRACCRILDFHETEKNALNSENPEEFIKLALTNFFTNQVSNIRAYRVNNPVYFLEAEGPQSPYLEASLELYNPIQNYDPELQFEVEAEKVEEELMDQFMDMMNSGKEAIVMNMLVKFMDQIKSSNPDFLAEIEKIISGSNVYKGQEISRLQLVPSHGGFDYKILLPDYDLEIIMPQLPKSLYLFFLKHTEGVYLHNLIDHKKELFHIYSRFSNLSDTKQMEENINRLINITDNSIHVNCARIKKAFLEKINKNLAQYYYVGGKRGEPKKIDLSATFIEIDKNLLS